MHFILKQSIKKIKVNQFVFLRRLLMKKISCLVPVLALLGACSNYNPDIDVAAEKRAISRSEIRDSIGCQFLDTQATYRECLLATYNAKKPRTYSVTTNANGQPVAVVSTGIVSTTQTVVNEPAQGVIMVNADGTPACPTAPGQPCTYQTQEIYQAQMPAIPCGDGSCPPMVEGPTTVTVTTTETVTEKPIEVVPMPEPLPEKTWWETYQEAKEPTAPKVVCPCPDPNDPCPQCVGK